MPDMHVEVIYYQTKTDFEMEFNLGGVCHMQLITAKTTTAREFVAELKKAVLHNRVIITVGRPHDEWGVCDIVAKATAHPLCGVDEKYGCTENCFDIPQTAVPLVLENGSLAGCILENNAQSIIMLTDKKALRHKALKALVHPYIADINNYTPATATPQEAVSDEQPEQQEQPVPDEPAEAITPDTDENAGAAVAPPVPTGESAGAEIAGTVTAVAVADTSALQAAVLAARQEEITKTVEALSEDDSPLSESAEIEAKTHPEPSVSEPVPCDEEREISSASESAGNGEPRIADPLPITISEEELFFDAVAEKKGKKHGKTLAIILVCIAVLIAAAFSYFKFFMPYRANAVYKSAAKKYGGFSAALPKAALQKFGKLYDENNAVCGWLSVGGTKISYPVVRSDSSFYDSHLYNKEYNLCGCPKTTQKITGSSNIRNLVITTKGSWVANLCGQIDGYDSLEFYKSAPIITFDSLFDEGTWKIFATFTYTGKSPVNYNRTDFSDDAEFENHIANVCEASAIVTAVDIVPSDCILTLVNTDKTGRTHVAVARKTRQDESVAVDVSKAVLAKDYDGTPLITSSHTSSEEVAAYPIEEVSSSSVPTSSAAVSSTKPNPKKALADPKSTQETPISQAEVKENLDEVAKLIAEQQKQQEEAQNQQQQQQSQSGGSSSAATPTPSDPNNGWLPLTATNSYTGAQVSGSAIEIIAQICAAEMGSSYEVEALKAQAVAAYCWMLCNGGATNKYPTVPMKTANDKIRNAVTAVAGKAAYYGKDKSGNDKIAQLYYYAYSAGVTANCSDIWSSDLPYLRTVDSSVDKNNKDFQTVRTYKASDLASWVKESTGIDLNGISDKNAWFHLTYADNGTSPYVKTLTFGNSAASYKGTYFRSTIITAARAKSAGYGNSYVLKSGAYSIAYNPSDDTFTFTVKGYGHGVGMSQYGANQYALQGYTYLQILQHYYPGITVK